MTDNANDKIAKSLMGDKLDGYLPERAKPKPEVRAVESLPLSVRARAAGPRSYDVPPVQASKGTPLGRREWEERIPALRTPHVLSEAKAHEKLAGIRKRVSVDGSEACFASEDWDLMVSEVVGMMLDCAEGAGLVVKNRAVGQMMRASVSRLLRQDMLFWGDDDRMLSIVVEE